MTKARQADGALVDRMVHGVRAAGLKLTPQRLAIVRELAADRSHPTAQELFERLHLQLPTMSFATVYNTLDSLRGAGLCVSLALAPGAGRFDPNMSPHHHAVCDRCGAVRDVPSEGVLSTDLVSGLLPEAGVASEVSQMEALELIAPGFVLLRVERIFRGVCADCASVPADGKGAVASGPHRATSGGGGPP